MPLGSPVPSSVNSVWLDQFMSEAESKKLRVDFICLHIYRGNNSGLFFQAVDDIYDKYRKPIWVTEAMIGKCKVLSSYINAFVNGAEIIIDVGVNAPGMKMTKGARKKLNKFIKEYDGFDSVKLISKNEKTISDYFLLTTVFYFILKFTRISEFGVDLPATIFSVLSIYYFIKFSEIDSKKDRKEYFFLTLILVLVLNLKICCHLFRLFNLILLYFR